MNVLVHILDENDNEPYFPLLNAEGWVSELAAPGSLVLTKEVADTSSIPLVITAKDPDSGRNGLLVYKIVESQPRRWFTIDSNTGEAQTS